MERVFQTLGAELEEASGMIAEFGRRLEAQRREMQELRDIAVMTQEMLELRTQESASTSATIHALRVSLDELRAREVAREEERIGMRQTIRELERRLRDTPRTP